MHEATILELLDAHRGSYISGDVLATKLKLSRTAIWKSIRHLRQQGYDIVAKTNKGYTLLADGDQLNPFRIRREVPELATLACVACCASTNQDIRNLSGPLPKLLISRAQDHGRGRYQRPFASPKGGLYMSLMSEGVDHPQQAVLLTMLSAVVVCEAIENIYQIPCGIKWLNDIWIGDRKVAGILCEANWELERGYCQYLICGIGLNLHDHPALQGQLSDIVTTLDRHTKKSIDPNALVIAITQGLLAGLARLRIGDTSFLDNYRTRNILLGKVIHVQGTACEALDIDAQGQLIVRVLATGSVMTLSSQEVTLHADA